MRLFRILLALVIFGAFAALASACADDGSGEPDVSGDGGPGPGDGSADRSTSGDRDVPDGDVDDDAGDEGGPKDATTDAPKDAADAGLDANIDGSTPEGSLLLARAAADGTNLTLQVFDVTVTHLRPAGTDGTVDPEGFTVQAGQGGPALFIAVNPSSLSPVPVAGDVVSFTITQMTTYLGQRRAAAVTAWTRASAGGDVGALTKNITASADLLTAGASYDSEVIDVTGAVVGAWSGAGPGFSSATITTTGMPNVQNAFVLRLPDALRDAIDAVPTCTFTLKRTPAQRINNQTQLTAFVASEIDLTNCPAPTVANAVPLSATSLRITFSRNVLVSSVATDGSQFTVNNGLTVSAASVSGRTVTLTTSAQTGGTMYTVTVANTVKDLQGTAVGNPNTASFSGFVQRAVVRINELNANITGSCDLIELRVVEGGSMQGFKITERQGNVGNDELNFTFGALVVAKNDFVIVHTRSADATCNPGNSTNETTAVNQNPTATFARNFDTAWDWYAPDNGLTNTDNVITLYDESGNILDAVFVSDDPAGATSAAGTEAQAAIVGAANQWMPKLATYIDTVFRTNAVDDLNATGTAPAGNSIQRIDDTDDNDKADWTTGAGAASTWGALNAGQTPF